MPPPACRLLPREPGQDRRRILDAARGLFAERGLGVRLSDIARHTGVGAGGPERWPASDRGLIDALLEFRVEELVELAASALHSPTRGAERGSGTIPTAPDKDVVAPPRRTPDWLEAFRATVSEGLGDPGASLREVARRFAMSPRTLQRRLAEEGTSWRREIDAARRDLAARLSRAGASNEVIAKRLGYADTRALRRALRRWNEQGRRR